MRSKVTPDWNTAPEWAMFFAINPDGVGWYFEEHPSWSSSTETWVPVSGSRREVVESKVGNGTLLKRGQNPK